MRIDLHSHSYYSDGFLSPTELLDLAKNHGCEALCLSDHDTTNGLDEAQIAADKNGIKLIHGVEISALWQNQTVHILGIDVDKTNPILQAGLKKHQDFREIRAQEMAKGLLRSGIKQAYEKSRELARNPEKSTMLTRTHFAQMLIKEGVCKNMNAVFKRFLTGNKPGGVLPQWQEMVEVVDWIRQAGGIAVMAHPFRYRFSRAKVGRLLTAFKAAGGQGVEVVTGNSDEGEIKLAAALARQHDLLASAGSDYHGWQGEYRQLGRLKPMPETLKTVWDNISII